ncbi:hypothetical protein FKM82_019419, partial [Ascaphus truei]
MATPGEGMATPGEGMATPGEGMATPGEGMATPREVVATPGEVVATPGEVVATPSSPGEGCMRSLGKSPPSPLHSLPTLLPQMCPLSLPQPTRCCPRTVWTGDLLTASFEGRGGMLSLKLTQFARGEEVEERWGIPPLQERGRVRGAITETRGQRRICLRPGCPMPQLGALKPRRDNKAESAWGACSELARAGEVSLIWCQIRTTSRRRPTCSALISTLCAAQQRSAACP